MQRRPVVGLLLVAAVLAISVLPGVPAGAVEPPITGTVTGPGGVPVAGATVRAHGLGCGTEVDPVPSYVVASDTTAADGTYSLAVGADCFAFLIEADPGVASALVPGWWGGDAEPMMPFRPADADLTYAMFAFPGGVADLVLGEPVALSGTVTFEGAPLPGATVHIGVRSAVDAESGDAELLVAQDVVTDVDGRWVLNGFGPGRWAIDVEPPPGSDAARTFTGGCPAPPLYDGTLSRYGEPDEPWPFAPAACFGAVDVASGATVVLDVAMVPGAVISGRVRTSDGDPVADASVTVGARMCWVHDVEWTWWTTPRTATTAADGSYRIAGLAPGADHRYSVDPPTASHREEGFDGVAWGNYCGYDLPNIELASGQVLEQSPILEPNCIGAAPFSDVPTSPDAVIGATCGEIEWLAGAGITNGYADGTFRPDAVLTRGAWITWLWRQAGSPGPYPDPGFSDVPPSLLFHPAVSWAAATGVANGYADGSFGAARPVSLQAASVMAWRLAGSPTSPTTVQAITGAMIPPSWTVPLSHPFRTALQWTIAVNLIDPDAFFGIWTDPLPHGSGPADPASRATATSILHDVVARTAS